VSRKIYEENCGIDIFKDFLMTFVVVDSIWLWIPWRERRVLMVLYILRILH